MTLFFVRPVIILTTLITLLTAPFAVAIAAGPLTLGVVSNNPQKAMNSFSPLMKYLDSEIGVTSEIVVLENTDQLAQAVSAKEVDFFLDSPFPAAKVCDKTGARFLLRQWKKGVAEYSGVIFTKSEKIKSLDDLKGELIAFEDPDSTSSYLLPMLLLKEANLPLAEKKSFREKATAGEVGYVFSGDDDNTLMWVKKNRVSAGGMKKQDIAGKPGLKILAESPVVPRSVVCVASHIQTELVQSLEKALMASAADNRAQGALNALSKTSRFDRFPQGSDSTLKQMLEFTKKLDY